MHDLPLIGWREWLILPRLGVPLVRTKVDTGARSSSLRVETLEEFARGGETWLRFTVATGATRPALVACEAPAADRRDVTDSGGHVTCRWFIRTTVRLAGVEWDAEINLTHRRNMLFPMLLGRTALGGRFGVDPRLSFACGKPRRRALKTGVAR